MMRKERPRSEMATEESFSHPEAMMDKGRMMVKRTLERSSTVLSDTRPAFLMKYPITTMRNRSRSDDNSVSIYIYLSPEQHEVSVLYTTFSLGVKGTLYKKHRSVFLIVLQPFHLLSICYF